MVLRVGIHHTMPETCLCQSVPQKSAGGFGGVLVTKLAARQEMDASRNGHLGAEINLTTASSPDNSSGMTGMIQAADTM